MPAHPYTKIGLIRVILDLADDDLMMLDEKNLSSEESNQILKARKRIEKAIRILTTDQPEEENDYESYTQNRRTRSKH